MQVFDSVCVFDNIEVVFLQSCFDGVGRVAPRRVIHPKRFAYHRSHGNFFQSSPGADHGHCQMVVLDKDLLDISR